MAKSTTSTASLKPYKDFPLTPHRGAKQWVKKWKGKSYYFGPLNDWDAALKRFNREWQYIIKGEPVPSEEGGDGYTIRDLCNAFIVHKGRRVKTRELSEHTYAEYFRTCEAIIAYFGETKRLDDLRPSEFEGFRAHLAEGCNLVTLLSKINRCRVVFNFAPNLDDDQSPVRFGKSFDRPSTKSLRTARNEAGERMFKAEEIRRILAAASQPLKAMVLLGVNCGFGNTDVATLPRSAVDLAGGWIEFPRPKTAVKRRVPLWPETVEAVRAAIASRPNPKQQADAGLCFLTVRGTRFVRVQPSKKTKDRHVTVNSLARRFSVLLHDLEINGRRGLGFYTLRHVFETIGGESKDQVAVNAIMGHVDESMAAAYREGISDERLRAVVDTVRAWLWPAA